MLTEWQHKRGIQNRFVYLLGSLIFLLQDGDGYSVVSIDSLKTFWLQWLLWRESIEISIELFGDFDEK
tara:strand:+ start:342 stop:545 length:204 start_codon:yes stop_codon:yes gene_type:complete